MKREYDSALELLDNILIKNEIPPKKMIEVLNIKSHILSIKGLVKEAFSIVNTGLELYGHEYKDNDNVNILKRLLHIKGVILTQMGNFVSAQSIVIKPISRSQR